MLASLLFYCLYVNLKCVNFLYVIDVYFLALICLLDVCSLQLKNMAFSLGFVRKSIQRDDKNGGDPSHDAH